MVKIYSDGADISAIEAMDAQDNIHGFTTNPSIIRKAGITDYAAFCEQAAAATSKPISFEVISDDFNEMEMQAHRLAAMGKNVYVKIPITNTRGDPSDALIRKLCADRIKVNVTAVMTGAQIKRIAKVLVGPPAILSIFAGRIADTGVDPRPYFGMAREVIQPNVKTLWASTREPLNVKQAYAASVDIITVPNDMLKKLGMFGYSLEQFSRETVQMFYDDAVASGFSL